MAPDEKITVSVSDGWVTLKGQVNWEYQRAAAANTVRDLMGVRGVSTTISVEPHVSTTAPGVKTVDDRIAVVP